MTAHELAQVLLSGLNDLVAVAGHGRLAFVSHAATEGGQKVRVLYVAEPEQAVSPVTHDDPRLPFTDAEALV